MSTSAALTRPANDEYVAFYETYVGKVPDGNVVGFLRDQRERALDLLRSIPDDRIDYRYAPEKWTVRQVLSHMLDAEWIFTYRALRFARGDTASLPGMDQNVFVDGTNFEMRDYRRMVDEFDHARAANTRLFESFDDAVLMRRGTASNCEFTVRAKLFIIAGHVEHHLHVLRERYLPS